MTMNTLVDDPLRATEHGLPEGWRWVQIRNAFTFTRKPRDIQISGYAHVPFVPMEAIPIGTVYFDQYVLKSQDELTSGTYFEPGDVLLAKITPSFENGKQGIIENLPTPFGIATTEVIPLQGIPGVSDKLFLFYYLLRHNIRAELAGKMEGTTGRQRLNKSALENLEIPLPPLPEQRAIAHALRTVQTAREARRRQAALERERKAALMQRLFTEGTRGEPTKTTEIGEVPVSWEVVRLGNYCEFLQYGTSKYCDNDSSGIPVLRIPNVIGGQVDTEALKYIRLPPKEAASLRLERGDILFVRTNGNKEYAGRCAVFQNELDDALFASYLIRARLDKRYLPEFVQLYTETAPGKSFLSGRASNAADGKYNINTQTIKSVMLPLTSIDEQRAIAEALRACDEKIAALEREAAAHDELFRALLEQLMTGRLRAIMLIER